MSIDDGLRFFATIRKSNYQTLHRETDDRRILLAWLDAHASSDDDLTITMEASGPAVPNTIAALRFSLPGEVELMTNEHTVLKLTEELVGKAAHRFEAVIKPDSLFHLVGLLQLALRHPDLAPASRALAHAFINGAREYFADCPTILDVIERGFDPAEDRPAGSPGW